ncbi:hypothetical protein [uncultured Microscilla sp.]|uniref:hypothetical protein n=1 Tax=uncultured Microscilla sp. TaxID=432653 RepID=UPI00262E1131|nr:hypothetical protein [uncultured Microscilla sp.]
MVLNDVYVKWQEEAPLGSISPDGNKVKLNDSHGYPQELEVIYFTSNDRQVACVGLEGHYYYQVNDKEWLHYEEIPYPDFDRYAFDFTPSSNDVSYKIRATYV